MSPDRLRGALAPTAVAVAGALAAGAVGAALWFGVSWAGAASDDGLELALARDEVLGDAEQAAVNLTTLDPANVQQTLALWEESATGPLLANFAAPQLADSIAGQPRTRSRSEDAALTALDLRAGTASALVALSLTAFPGGREEPRPLQRLVVELVRTDDGWKATGFDVLDAEPT